jgi:hypothetical protein
MSVERDIERDVEYTASVIRLCHDDLRKVIVHEREAHDWCNAPDLPRGGPVDDVTDLARISEVRGFHRALDWVLTLLATKETAA